MSQTTEYLLTEKALKVKVLDALNSEIPPVLRLLKRAMLGPLYFTEYFATVLSSTNHILPVVSFKVHAKTINRRVEYQK